MLEIIDALELQQHRYMLVGSFSSNFYGIPRSTHDVDIVIELADQAIQALTRQLGPRYVAEPQMQFEGVTGTTRHLVDVTGTQFQVELFRTSSDAHDQERFARRIRVDWLGRQVWLPTPEDVIVTKLRWLSHLRRGKDYDDVLGVISVQGPRLDWSYIENWCRQHQTLTFLAEARSAALPDE
jgi:hypothetical protein